MAAYIPSVSASIPTNHRATASPSVPIAMVVYPDQNDQFHNITVSPQPERASYLAAYMPGRE